MSDGDNARFFQRGGSKQAIIRIYPVRVRCVTFENVIGKIEDEERMHG